MNLLYKVTFRNSLSHFYPVIFAFLGIAIATFISVFDFGSERLWLYFKVAALIFGTYSILPTLFLHITYQIENWKSELIIDTKNAIAAYSGKGKLIEFKFGEIGRIDVFMTPGLERRAPGWVTWDTYHFLRITLVNSDVIFITCLMANNLEFPIDRSKVKLHQTLFPYLRSR
jgi:hypothetical protein